MERSFWRLKDCVEEMQARGLRISFRKNIPEAEPYMLIWNVSQNIYLREKKQISNSMCDMLLLI